MGHMGLTRQQKRLLDFIEHCVAVLGYPPSYEEMKVELGLRSKSGIHRMILALEERGCIRRLPDRARAIEPLSHIEPDSVMMRLGSSTLHNLKSRSKISGLSSDEIAARAITFALRNRRFRMGLNG